MNWRSRVRALLTVVGCAVAADLGPAIGATAQQPAGQGSGRGAGGPAAVPLHADRREQGLGGHARRDEGDVRQVVRRMGRQEKQRTDPGTGLMGVNAAFPAPAAAQTPPQNQTPASGRRQGDDGRAPRRGAGQAQAAAEGARPRQGGRLRALLDPARGPDNRGNRQEDRRVVDDDHL